MTRDSPKVVTNTFIGFLGGCALAGLALLLAPRPRARRPVPAPKPEPFAGRIYGGTLKPPASRAFTAEESRRIRGRMDDWLSRALARTGGTFYVLAAERDADAVAVYNLVAAFLKARGEGVNVEEEDVAEGSQLLRTRSRGLIYCGGLDESGQIPPRGGEDEELVLVVRSRAADAARLEGLQASLAEAGWTEPYLIKLDR